MWSSLLCFVTWIVTMHSEKGGRAAGKEVALHPYVLQFLCPWYPHVLEGKRRRDGLSQHSEGQRDLPDLALWQVWWPGRFRGACKACPSMWSRILDPSHAVLTQGSIGSPQALVFSEFQSPFKLRKPYLTPLTFEFIFMSFQKLLLFFYTFFFFYSLLMETLLIMRKLFRPLRKRLLPPVGEQAEKDSLPYLLSFSQV